MSVKNSITEYRSRPASNCKHGAWMRVRIVNSHSTFNQPPFRTPAYDGPRDASGRPLTRGVAPEYRFRGTQEIGIEHEGSLYRLKITRQGKLILNK